MSWTVPTGCYYAVHVYTDDYYFVYYGAGQSVPDNRSPTVMTASDETSDFVLIDFANGYIYTSFGKFTITISGNSFTIPKLSSWISTPDSRVFVIASNAALSAIEITLQGDPFTFGDGSGVMDKFTVSARPYSMLNSFYDRDDITSATVPDGVSYFENTFYNCSSLVTVTGTLSNLITAYGAFNKCSSLTTPPTFQSMGTGGSGTASRLYSFGYCFSGCSSLVTPPSLPPSGVTTMQYCFYNCKALTTAPTIPSSATNMTSCFGGCSSLTSAPTIPNSVTNLSRCFESCTLLATAPAIPSSVTTLDSTFINCTSLVTPPDLSNATSVTTLFKTFQGCKLLQTPPVIPSSVTTIQSCFYNCEALTTTPTLPATVTSIGSAFGNCKSLSGNIIVYNNPSTSYNDAFKGTQNDIFVVNATGSSIETIWKTITASYSNVHYEADDNTAPSASISVTRVGAMVSETPVVNGEYAYINVTVQLYDDYLPVGWANSFGTKTLEKDGVTISPIWTETSSGNIYTLKCWDSLSDTTKHTFEFVSTDNIENENSILKATHTSNTVTQILAKAYKLVDYYHDPNTDTEGMAVGKFATDADLFDVDMPTLFRDSVIVDTDMTAQEVEAFVDSLDIQKVLKSAETKTFLWSNSATTFAAQTVSLDLSVYDYIEVWFYPNNAVDVLLPNPLMIPIGEERSILLLHNLGGAGVNENTGSRNVAVTSNSVVFGNYAYKNRRSGGTLTTSNDFAVPEKIYGVTLTQL